MEIAQNKCRLNTLLHKNLQKLHQNKAKWLYVKSNVLSYQKDVLGVLWFDDKYLSMEREFHHFVLLSNKVFIKIHKFIKFVLIMTRMLSLVHVIRLCKLVV